MRGSAFLRWPYSIPSTAQLFIHRKVSPLKPHYGFKITLQERQAGMEEGSGERLTNTSSGSLLPLPFQHLQSTWRGGNSPLCCITQLLQAAVEHQISKGPFSPDHGCIVLYLSPDPMQRGSLQQTCRNQDLESWEWRVMCSQQLCPGGEVSGHGKLSRTEQIWRSSWWAWFR